jgi:hypothetical protein
MDGKSVMAPSALARLDWPEKPALVVELVMVRPRLVAVEGWEGDARLGILDTLAFPFRFAADEDWARIAGLGFELDLARPFRLAEEFCLSILCLLM